MAGAHEQVEHAEHVGHAAQSNRGVALLISVLALFLALSEMLGKSAQTEAISANIQASDLWNFFQAKTIRITTLRTAAEALEIDATRVTDPALKETLAKRIETWRKTAERYESEPETQEGRKELMARAHDTEHRRDTALARYHHYEVASAAFQIGIVLASAEVITGMIALVWLSGGLGIAGLAFMAIGFIAPHAVHLF